MSLPASGPISSSMIANELRVSSVDFSQFEAEVLSYTGLNAASISSSNNSIKIDYELPLSMSAWYTYDHSLTLSGSEVASSGLLAPSPELSKTMSIQETFLQYDLGVSNITASFTASNFVSSGAAPGSEVSYSVYYSTYSIALDAYPQKLIKLGVLTASSPNSSFNYVYNAASGSVVTFRFQNVHSYFIYNGGG